MNPVFKVTFFQQTPQGIGHYEGDLIFQDERAYFVKSWGKNAAGEDVAVGLILLEHPLLQKVPGVANQYLYTGAVTLDTVP